MGRYGYGTGMPVMLFYLVILVLGLFAFISWQEAQPGIVAAQKAFDKQWGIAYCDPSDSGCSTTANNVDLRYSVNVTKSEIRNYSVECDSWYGGHATCPRQDLMLPVANFTSQVNGITVHDHFNATTFTLNCQYYGSDGVVDTVSLHHQIKFVADWFTWHVDSTWNLEGTPC